MAGWKAKICKSFHPGGTHSVEVHVPIDTWCGQLAQRKVPRGGMVAGTLQVLSTHSPAQLRRVGVAHDGGGDQAVGRGAAEGIPLKRGRVDTAAVGAGDEISPMTSRDGAHPHQSTPGISSVGDGDVAEEEFCAGNHSHVDSCET